MISATALPRGGSFAFAYAGSGLRVIQFFFWDQYSLL